MQVLGVLAIVDFVGTVIAGVVLVAVVTAAAEYLQNALFLINYLRNLSFSSSDLQLQVVCLVSMLFQFLAYVVLFVLTIVHGLLILALFYILPHQFPYTIYLTVLHLLVLKINIVWNL